MGEKRGRPSSRLSLCARHDIQYSMMVCPGFDRQMRAKGDPGPGAIRRYSMSCAYAFSVVGSDARIAAPGFFRVDVYVRARGLSRGGSTMYSFALVIVDGFRFRGVFAAKFWKIARRAAPAPPVANRPRANETGCPRWTAAAARIRSPRPRDKSGLLCTLHVDED